MGRRIVPLTFWSGILLVAVLLLVDRAMASRPPVPDVLGAWDGFFQEAGDDGAPGLVRSTITQQDHRRIAGEGVLLDPDGDVLLDAYNFRATVARDDFITGTGPTPTGRVVFDADLETFAGGEGDAGVMSPRFLFVPVRGRASRIGAILLHPFPDVNAPDIAGQGTGIFHSEIDPSFRGDLAVDILPRERGGFSGHVDFMPRSVLDPPFSWQLRATTSDDGRFVMIAQGRTGSLVADGTVIPGGVDGSPDPAVWGIYSLRRLDGRFDFGAYNFDIASPIR